MTYREIGISIRSAYSQGWPDDASRLAFRTETRKLFRDAGWQVEEMPLDSGHCDTVRNGKDALYLHPTVLSGVMQEDHIPELQQLLSSAATFRERNGETCSAQVQLPRASDGSSQFAA